MSSDDNENKEPAGKVRNIKSGENLLDDSFFDLDDSLGEINFSKLGADDHESISDIVNDKNIKLSSKDSEPLKNNENKLKASSLPTVKLNKNIAKETEMNKKQLDTMGFGEEEPDPNATQIKEIWDQMSTPSAAEFKLMVSRMEPQMIKGTKISGYLETFHLPTTIPDIIEQIGQKYGGGRFQIRIVDGSGRYVKSKSFEISGLPKIPSPDQMKENTNLPTSEEKIISTDTVEKKKITADVEEQEEEEEEEEFEFPATRRKLRPMNSMYDSPYTSMGSNYSSYSDPYNRQSFKKDDAPSKEDLERLSREMEEKVVNKLETKFDKVVDLVASMNTKKSESFLNADVVKALAPVVVAWMDTKTNKDTSQAGQYTEMNKQVVSLMQGMQDLVRIGDKSKEDFAERERREREQNRREMLDHQSRLEEKFLEQQRLADQKHQEMVLQMREVLERKHNSAQESDGKFRLEYEKMREEFRQREEQARREAREREEKLREDIRAREEDTRRKEHDQMNRVLQEERKWQEELRHRDDAARQREIAYKEELRLKELEITSKLRDMDAQRTDINQKLLEQIYNNNLGNRESQLHMELAIAKMTSENESKMLQANAQMELEKIRHATQMQMSKMKHELTQVENKKDDDPFAASMQEYLQRKLQVDMVKELNMDVHDDDLPSRSFMDIIKKVVSEGAGPLLQILLSGGGGMPGMRPPAPAPIAPPRVVNPSPAPVRHEEDEDDEDEVEIEDEEDEVDEEVEQEEVEEEVDEDEAETEPTEPPAPEPQVASTGQEFYGIDPMQEIPKVAAFFEYLKDSIETGNATAAQAAKQAEETLSGPVVAFLKNIDDSRVIIAQLQPLLLNMYSQDFVNFFLKDETLDWMNKMLAALAGKVVEEPKQAEPKQAEPKQAIKERKSSTKKKKSNSKTSI